MFGVSVLGYAFARALGPVVSGLDMLERPAAFSGIVFGIFSIPALLHVLPNATYLQLDKAGLTARTFFVTVHIRWSDINEFRVVHLGHLTQRVGICLTGPIIARTNDSNREGPLGCDRLLPCSYGMTPDALAALLNELHRLYERQGADNGL